MSVSQMRAYYLLCKPGIVYGNAMAALAGFFLAASQVPFHLGPLIGMLVGTSLVIASACVFNNLIDQGIDAKMERTKKRALVLGEIQPDTALMFAVILGIVGFLILIFGVNVLTALTGLVGFVVYVLVYTPLKPRSHWATLVGSISGAVPPVAGYAALTGHLDVAAGLLFLIMTVWQMPHFYAIAIRRREEYKSASVPVLPLVRGIATTRRRMIGYIISFILIAPLLTVFEYTGIIYAIGSVVLGAYWLRTALRYNEKYDDADTVWARRVFFASLRVLMGECLLIAIGGFLP